MKMKIELFESAMCCPTGLCGPSINTEVLRISTVVDFLDQKGITIKRYNLTSNTKEFVSNKTINEMLDKEGDNILPITIVDGKVEKKGAYPSNAEFKEWTGITIETNKPKKNESGCGCGETGCR
ncbi:MAG: arsenite efflux transporter metallochaperone ArsD [Candidatus Aenigmarchaeota archaeon]|nr:arsenite efflux transporter metallochaperone ArsD [Candidatus Aenigmarchaeota archaeon]